LGHPVTLVHRPMHNVLFDRAIADIRGGAGTIVIRKKAAAKEALRTLKQRGIVVVPSDQNQTARFGVFVDFFGKPACTTPGAARLAMLTGAPIIPVFLVRDGEGPRHRIEVLPDVEIAPAEDRESAIQATTERCSKVVEEMIRRYPEQWIWFHKRWKTRPAGEPRLY
jgi:KDO2-lipid IV(A) lauroyltransferase